MGLGWEIEWAMIYVEDIDFEEYNSNIFQWLITVVLGSMIGVSILSESII